MKREQFVTILLFGIIFIFFIYAIVDFSESINDHSYSCKEYKKDNIKSGDLLVFNFDNKVEFAHINGIADDTIIILKKGKTDNTLINERILELLNSEICSTANLAKDSCCSIESVFHWMPEIISNPTLFEEELNEVKITDLESFTSNDRLVVIGRNKETEFGTGLWMFAGCIFISLFLIFIHLFYSLVVKVPKKKNQIQGGIILLMSFLIACDQTYSQLLNPSFWLILVQYTIVFTAIKYIIKYFRKDVKSNLNVSVGLIAVGVIFFIGIISEYLFFSIISQILKPLDIYTYHKYLIENLEKEQYLYWSSFSLAYLIFVSFKSLKEQANLYDHIATENLSSLSSLASIQSRINPHFLYNALNSIASLARTEPKKTEEMALQLAKFYGQFRYIKSTPLITLTEELDILKSYLMIEKIRFGDRLQVSLPTDSDVTDVIIPSFTLQPIVENAIKYGYNTAENVIHIRITAEKNEKSLILRIYDSGPPFSDDMHSGYGLSSIVQKLKVLYPNRHTISYINEPEKCVEIMLDVMP